MLFWSIQQRSSLRPKAIFLFNTSCRNVILPFVRHSTGKPTGGDVQNDSQTSLQNAATSKSPHRFKKILRNVPKFLHKYLQPIANKPISHVTAFVILHEERTLLQAD